MEGAGSYVKDTQRRINGDKDICQILIVAIHWTMRLWGTFYFLLDYLHVLLNLNE